VVLRHRQVLVHQASALEENEADDLLVLHAEQEHDRAHPVGKLPREPSEHLGIAVAELVVDRSPAVARRGHDAPRRAARQAWDELTDRADDRVDVVRLDVDGPERPAPASAQPPLERLDRCCEDPRLFGETGAGPPGCRIGVHLDPNGVAAGGPGLPDQALENVVAGWFIDRHQDNTRRPVKR
jgi:hypothetical protein